jgi:hypothetical protein
LKPNGNFLNKSNSSLSVRLGAHNLDTDNTNCTENVFRSRTLQIYNGDLVPLSNPCKNIYQEIEIKSVLYHPEIKDPFDITSHDIALIHLKEPANRNITNQICLPFMKESWKPLPKQFEVIGWGKTEKSRRSNELRRAVVSAVDVEKCKFWYGSRVQNAEHICAGDIDLEIDSCDGN